MAGLVFGKLRISMLVVRRVVFVTLGQFYLLVWLY
jgi:hypothetical protein